MDKNHVQVVVKAITLPPPPITSYNGIWNYSNDVLLYDEEGNEWVGYAVYRWEGDDDAPQIASWENFEGWHSDDKGWCSESVVLWQPLTDDVMETAFARLADELEAQAAAELREMVDKATVMDYALSRYAEISNDAGGMVRLLTPNRDWVRWDRVYDGKGFIHDVAEWVRKQGGEP